MRVGWLLSLLALSPLAADRLTLAPMLPPFLAVDTLPEPPMQHAPWAAEGLPAELVATARLLFEQGLPDPRGCEYRTVAAFARHAAWLLPANNAAQRLAIGWDGFIYPVTDVGEPADLAADVAAVRRAKQVLGWRDPVTADGRPPTGLSPLTACLLARLGLADAATDIWTRWHSAKSASLPAADGYLAAAGQWVMTGYEQALGAQMRSDDRLALASLRRLALARPAITKEIDRRIGTPRDRIDTPYDLRPLDAVPAMLADQERRSQSPRPVPCAVGPAAYASREAYIAALIEDLSEARGFMATDMIGHWFWTPVDVDNTGDPMYPYPMPFGGYLRQATTHALLTEGVAAVPAPIDCLEHDTRLTRVGLTERQMRHPRGLMPVTHLAGCALLAIMESPNTTIDPKRTAAEARGWLALYGHLPPAERHYRLLLDEVRRDPRGYRAWEAALRLVRTRETARFADRRPSGTALVAEVTDAMIGRDQDAAPVDWGHVSSLARALLRSGEPGALAAVRRIMARMQSRGAPATELMALWLRRDELGDPAALTEYVAWVRSLDVDRWAGSSCLEPLWARPGNAALRGLAETLFEDPRSPLNPVTRPPWEGTAAIWQGQSALLALPAARRQSLAVLANTSQAGEVELWPSHSVAYVTVGQSRHNVTQHWALALPTKPALELSTFRVCDAYAYFLSKARCGLPEMQLYWPLERRDEAVRQAAQFLRRYGDRLRNDLRPYGLRGQAQVVLPPLDHPATPADVEAGRALFALGSERATRVVELPQRPLPIDLGSDDQTDRSGAAWQAEERLEGGRWRRYLGCVMSNGVAMLPADQVTISSRGAPWTSDLKATLEPVSAAQPTVLALRLRNIRAVPVTVPAVWLRQTAEGLACLRAGLTVTLTRRAAAPTERRYGLSPPVAWRVGPATSPGFADDGRRRELAPYETFVAGQIDLRRLVDRLEPGDYTVLLEPPTKVADGGWHERLTAKVTVPARDRP